MSTYELVVFLHVASAVGLFGVLAIEWVSLRGLRGSTTYEQAREWSGLWRLLMLLGLPATLVVLASGIYLATTGGMWSMSWVAVALPTYVAIIVAGGIAGPRRNRIDSALRSGSGPFADDVRRQTLDPILVASWRSRAALLFAILFIMTVKATWALWAVSLFAFLGAVWSLPAWSRHGQPPPVQHQRGQQA
jgi:hypothetical protein